MSEKKAFSSKIKSTIKFVSGTAGEAFENSTFDKMVDKYGEDTAYKVFESELLKAGETVESFKTYRRVKYKVQNNMISTDRASKVLAEEVKKVMREEFGELTA